MRLRVFTLCLAAGLLLQTVPAEALSTVVTRGQATCRQVALTFDAGAGIESADGILDALGQRRIRSTFFLTGQWTDDFPALAAEVAARGHDPGNHTDTHPDLTGVTDAVIRAELRTDEAKIVAVTGKNPRPWFRPPFGEFDNRVLRVVEEEGYPFTIMWDIDTIDWQHPPAQVIVDRVLGNVQRGSIVLMHMGGLNTAAAVAQMLPLLEQRGFMMVTVGEALGFSRPSADFGGRAVFVQAGDTLNQIAGCFKTTAPIVAAANDLANPDVIVPGQRLAIPLRDEVTVRVNGTKLNLATPARVVAGRTFVHVRALAEALGAGVAWDPDLRQVTLTKGATVIRLTVGSATALVNGSPELLEAAPFIADDRLQVPLRFAAERLGAAVSWDPVSRTAGVVQ